MSILKKKRNSIISKSSSNTTIIARLWKASWLLSNKMVTQTSTQQHTQRNPNLWSEEGRIYIELIDSATTKKDGHSEA